MFKPRTQAKVKVFFLQIAISILFVTTILGLESIMPRHVAAAQLTTSQSATPIFSNQMLFPSPTGAPSPAISFPVIDQLDTTAQPSTASPEAAMSQAEYCLDVPVIMYHHVEPLSIAAQLGHEPLTVDNGIFDEQIRYLVEHNYHLLSTEDLVIAIRTRGTLPEKSVVITIDDGYIDNYTYAFLVAKKYHVVMNFMIPTGLVGQPDYMTWDHLKEMAQSPYVKLYNHTTTHPPLGLIDKETIVKEITTANQDFATQLGIKNDIVVYPYGSYSDLAINTLKELHMVAAISTDPGRNECISNIMKLPRIRVGNAPISEYGF